MRFVHSLVTTTVSDRVGWVAPLELGEAAPAYISFVIPIGRIPDSEYACDVIVIRRGERASATYEMTRGGTDSFLLRIDRFELWFVYPAPRKRRWPYIGQLEHPDFTLPFTEIEPEEPSALDVLLEEKGVSVVGCDPFARYSGIDRLRREARET